MTLLREHVGRRTRDAAGRLGHVWWSIGQSALGAGVAWTFAVQVLHHEAPFFAAVAAIVSLSITVSARLRRVLELSIGVSIGVGLGELLISQIGRGSWQLAATVAIAMLLAVALDGGNLIVTQAALQAVFVVAMPPPQGGPTGRILDALVGGGTALLVAFLLPADPRPDLRAELDRLVTAVASAVRRAADAARTGDDEGALDALEDIRATQAQLDAWRDAVTGGQEINRLSPLRRRTRAEVEAHDTALPDVDRAVRNLRVALRSVSVVTADPALPPFPPHLLDLLDDVAGALYTLPGLLRDPHGEGGRRTRAALDSLTDELRRLGDVPPTVMPHTVVLAQMRATVIDLHQATGLEYDDARARLVGRA